MLKDGILRKISVAFATTLVILAGGFAFVASTNPNFMKSSGNSNLAANIEDVMETEAVSGSIEMISDVSLESAIAEENSEAATLGEHMTMKEELTMTQELASTESVILVEDLTDDHVNAAKAKENALEYSEEINQVFNLINGIRQSQGLESLVLDETLTQAACHRSYENAINDCFKVDSETGHHLRPNGEKASTIVGYYKVYGYFGEVMGRYQTTTEEIVNGWVNSASHYSVLVSDKYTKVGVGLAKDSNGHNYWTAIFMS